MNPAIRLGSLVNPMWKNRSKPPKYREHSSPDSAAQSDGFKVRKGHDGYVFTEGRRVRKMMFTNQDNTALNACLRRRGIMQ